MSISLIKSFGLRLIQIAFDLQQFICTPTTIANMLSVCLAVFKLA